MVFFEGLDIINDKDIQLTQGVSEAYCMVLNILLCRIQYSCIFRNAGSGYK